MDLMMASKTLSDKDEDDLFNKTVAEQPAMTQREDRGVFKNRSISLASPQSRDGEDYTKNQSL